ncbi:MAG: Mur ligase family protein, partial [Propionibacteriaceae bacterium]|nr:Mur ligase family protein [Propionibacteriaceae bacterium]
AGVTTVIMEATSQGFMMHRTDGVQFNIGVFTNISHDHISPLEHPSFEHYFACKKRIFDQSDVVVVNRDAELFDQIVDGVTTPLKTYGLSDGVDYHGEIEAGNEADHTQRFTCQAPDFTGEFEINLVGKFNVSNALCAIAVADLLGLPVAAMKAGVATAKAMGRLEVLDVPAPYTVLIDFAHNRLSMEAMIEGVQAYHPKHLLAVFGLEGDRSHERRFDCGEMLGRYMDYTILSDASPRMDNPDQILADIATGIERGGGAGKHETIRDRHISIPKILDMAQPGDVVLLVGKGAVTYEEVKGVNYPFDERDVVAQYFAK